MARARVFAVVGLLTLMLALVAAAKTETVKTYWTKLNATPTTIVKYDVDGDGAVELYMPPYWILDNGAVSPSPYPKPVDWCGVGDWDGDGVYEMLLYSRAGKLYVYKYDVKLAEYDAPANCAVVTLYADAPAVVNVCGQLIWNWGSADAPATSGYPVVYGGKLYFAYEVGGRIRLAEVESGGEIVVGEGRLLYADVSGETGRIEAVAAADGSIVFYEVDPVNGDVDIYAHPVRPIALHRIAPGVYLVDSSLGVYRVSAKTIEYLGPGRYVGGFTEPILDTGTALIVGGRAYPRPAGTVTAAALHGETLYAVIDGRLYAAAEAILVEPRIYIDTTPTVFEPVRYSAAPSYAKVFIDGVPAPATGTVVFNDTERHNITAVVVRGPFHTATSVIVKPVPRELDVRIADAKLELASRGELRLEVRDAYSGAAPYTTVECTIQSTQLGLDYTSPVGEDGTLTIQFRVPVDAELRNVHVTVRCEGYAYRPASITATLPVEPAKPSLDWEYKGAGKLLLAAKVGNVTVPGMLLVSYNGSKWEAGNPAIIVLPPGKHTLSVEYIPAEGANIKPARFKVEVEYYANASEAPATATEKIVVADRVVEKTRVEYVNHTVTETVTKLVTVPAEEHGGANVNALLAVSGVALGAGAALLLQNMRARRAVSSATRG